MGNENFKIWYVFNHANPLASDREQVKVGGFNFYAYETGDKFRTKEGRIIWIFNENSDINQPGFKIETICVDDINTQDDLGMLKMLSPSLPIEEISIEKLQAFRASLIDL